MDLTIAKYFRGLDEGSFTIEEICRQYLNKIQNLNPKLNAVLRTDANLKNQDFGSFLSGPLRGLPILVKDNILINGEICSCASLMLKDFKAPYDATCIVNLKQAGALLLGQTNMDEFAMGWSNETSAFGPCLNPYGQDRVPGGSSWGSASAVAAGLAIAALGTDTGGSVRQPASMCGIVGFKPTYGAISRYGVVAMASSLDQVGIFTKTVEESQFLFSFLAGYDPKDATSDPRADQIKIAQNYEIRGARFFVPEEVINDWLDPQIKALFVEKIEALKRLGHSVEIKSLPILQKSLAIYYTLMPSEVSTNLSRFDGVRFWMQKSMEEFWSLDQYYGWIRAEGFWEEVKRRILLGTFILSSANYESYYLKALAAQRELREELNMLFDEYDAILTPTSPEAAWKIGSKVNDPLKMYLADLYTVPANLAWLPAISVPMGSVVEGGDSLPVGIQVMGKAWSDQSVFLLAKEIEKLSW